MPSLGAGAGDPSPPITVCQRLAARFPWLLSLQILVPHSNLALPSGVFAGYSRQSAFPDPNSAALSSCFAADAAARDTHPIPVSRAWRLFPLAAAVGDSSSLPSRLISTWQLFFLPVLLVDILVPHTGPASPSSFGSFSCWRFLSFLALSCILPADFHWKQRLKIRSQPP